MIKCKIVRYSETFKLQILKEMEESNLSVADIQKKYRITGGEKIRHWIRKYGKMNLISRIVSNVIVRKNQAWVSDITYVRKKSGFCYVS